MSHSLLSQSECRHYCIPTVYDDIIVAMTVMSSCALAVYVLGECVVSSVYYIVGSSVCAFPLCLSGTWQCDYSWGERAIVTSPCLCL